MKLTDLQRKIIAHSQLNSDLPFAELAKRCAVSVDSVRRTVNQLRDRGVIQRRVYIAPVAVGQFEVSVFFALGQETINREMVHKTLATIPRITLVLELGGEFDFAFTAIVDTPQQISAMLDTICSVSGMTIALKKVHVRYGWMHFGSKYIFSRMRSDPILMDGTTSLKNKLDEFDRRILCAYSESPDGNLAEVARQLSQPRTTVLHRIEALRKWGIIRAVIYQLMPSTFGYLGFRLLLALSRPNTSNRDQIAAWAANHSHVVSLTYGIGEWDCELRLEVPDNRTANNIRDEARKKFRELVSHFTLLPVMGAHFIRTFPLGTS